MKFYKNVQYSYTCKKETKELKDDQETKVEHGRYFFVVCHECCNMPVFHMLDRASNN